MRAVPAALVAAAIAAASASAQAEPTLESHVLQFDVFRNGSPLGSHNIVAEQRGDELFVDAEIDLRVKIGPFTAFRYTHSVREEWNGDRLVRLESETLKDGDRFSLVAETVEGAGLFVDGRDYTGEAPNDIRPTTWWNKDLLTDDDALNTETGAILPITVEPLGRETILAGGREIEAERFRVQASLTVDLWYDDEGHWVKCAFETRGSSIEYVLAGPARES